MLPRVTVAIDTSAQRERIVKLLQRNDVLTQVAPENALEWSSLPPFPTDILVVSRSLIPVPMEQNIQTFTSVPNAAAVVVISSEQLDEARHTSLQAAGAIAVLFSELDTEEIGLAMDTIIENKREVLNKLIIARRSSARPHLSDFISDSKSMQSFVKVVKKIVDSDSNLLITGETGVGKERLARAIHAASRRANGPFISINCGAIPESLMESELFGHIKGSFTGASSNKRGCFELAHNGILFLDEISEMPLNLQVKLLHVLQDFNIRPVGSERVISVDARVVAATNRNLQSEMEEKRFRNDLYYRLSILTLTVPPLRERSEDIPVLAESFVDELSDRIGRNVEDMSQDVLKALCKYSWPGNVRELINVIERAIILTESTRIEISDLPEEISGVAAADTMGYGPTDTGNGPPAISDLMLGLPLKEGRQRVVERYEREYLRSLLKRTHGCVGETAALAGIVPRSLFSKMRKYGLRKENFKGSASR